MCQRVPQKWSDVSTVIYGKPFRDDDDQEEVDVDEGICDLFPSEVRKWRFIQ